MRASRPAQPRGAADPVTVAAGIDALAESLSGPDYISPSPIAARAAASGNSVT
jgi:hypothetical protein